MAPNVIHNTLCGDLLPHCNCNHRLPGIVWLVHRKTFGAFPSPIHGCHNKPRHLLEQVQEQGQIQRYQLQSVTHQFVFVIFRDQLVCLAVRAPLPVYEAVTRNVLLSSGLPPLRQRVVVNPPTVFVGSVINQFLDRCQPETFWKVVTSRQPKSRLVWMWLVDVGKPHARSRFCIWVFQLLAIIPAHLSLPLLKGDKGVFPVRYSDDLSAVAERSHLASDGASPDNRCANTEEPIGACGMLRFSSRNHRFELTSVFEVAPFLILYL